MPECVNDGKKINYHEKEIKHVIRINNFSFFLSLQLNAEGGRSCGTCIVSSEPKKNTGKCKACVGSKGDACVFAWGRSRLQWSIQQLSSQKIRHMSAPSERQHGQPFYISLSTSQELAIHAAFRRD